MSVRVEVGNTVRDKLSELEGLVVARTDWLYGCVRITIQPKGAKDGKPFESFSVDEPQCEIIDSKADTSAPNHGPKPEPSRH